MDSTGGSETEIDKESVEKYQDVQLKAEPDHTVTKFDSSAKSTEVWKGEDRKQELKKLYPYQLFYLLHSFESAAIVLSYFGYSGQVAEFLQKFSKRSRTYYKSDHKECLMGFLEMYWLSPGEYFTDIYKITQEAIKLVEISKSRKDHQLEKKVELIHSALNDRKKSITCTGVCTQIAKGWCSTDGRDVFVMIAKSADYKRDVTVAKYASEFYLYSIKPTADLDLTCVVAVFVRAKKNTKWGIAETSYVRDHLTSTKSLGFGQF